MNRDVEKHDSDESDSDFCPDKEAGNEVSEEDSTELSSSDEEKKNEEKLQGKHPTKMDSSKKQPAKKFKGRKVVKPQEKASRTSSDSEDECAPVDIERKRNTRQSGAEAKRLSSAREMDNLESDEEDKSRSDALWADFLSDVKPNGSGKITANEQTSSNSAEANSGKAKATTNAENGHCGPKNATKGEITTPRNIKVKTTETNVAPLEKIKVTEIVDFAGEEVCVEKEVNADSVKENKSISTLQHKTSGAIGARAAGLQIGLKRSMAAGGGASGSGAVGLGSILNQIGKKKKISVLEKSQLDWKSFKQNEGIEEELQTFNKGRDGYLERQDFLQRTDLRQFEIEKNLRQSKRNN